MTIWVTMTMMIKNDIAPKSLKFQGRLNYFFKPKVDFERCILGHLLLFDLHDWCIEMAAELERHMFDHFHPE